MEDRAQTGVQTFINVGGDEQRVVFLLQLCLSICASMRACERVCVCVCVCACVRVCVAAFEPGNGFALWLRA